MHWVPLAGMDLLNDALRENTPHSYTPCYPFAALTLSPHKEMGGASLGAGNGACFPPHFVNLLSA